jgi:GAF domain-containing protein
MEPVPETREVLDRIGQWSDSDLLAGLQERGDRVRRVVPSCVGLSVSYNDSGLTFTLVASSSEIAALDGVQYAVGGPCVDAVLENTVIGAGDERGLLDERRWADFARSAAAQGVASTLSMPVHQEGRIIGGVNVYAAEPQAFDGKHDHVAAAVGAWAPGAITNADLSFSTRVAARRAPGLLEEQDVLGQATGVIMAARGVDREAAREVIAQAATLSGAGQVEIARAIIQPHVRPDGS